MVWYVFNYECEEPVDKLRAPSYSQAERQAIHKHGSHIMVIDRQMFLERQRSLKDTIATGFVLPRRMK